MIFDCFTFFNELDLLFVVEEPNLCFDCRSIQALTLKMSDLSFRSALS